MTPAQPHHGDRFEVASFRFRVPDPVPMRGFRAAEVHLAIDPWSRLVTEHWAGYTRDRQLVLDVLGEQCDENGCCDRALIAWGSRALGCSERILRRWLKSEMRPAADADDEGGGEF